MSATTAINFTIQHAPNGFQQTAIRTGRDYIHSAFSADRATTISLVQNCSSKLMKAHSITKALIGTQFIKLAEDLITVGEKEKLQLEAAQQKKIYILHYLMSKIPNRIADPDSIPRTVVHFILKFNPTDSKINFVSTEEAMKALKARLNVVLQRGLEAQAKLKAGATTVLDVELKIEFENAKNRSESIWKRLADFGETVTKEQQDKMAALGCVQANSAAASNDISPLAPTLHQMLPPPPRQVDGTGRISITVPAPRKQHDDKIH